MKKLLWLTLAALVAAASFQSCKEPEPEPEPTHVVATVTASNLVDAAATCTNTFGTLDLAAGTELKLRVWKTNGAITAHDGLNVGEYVNNGGRITLEQMDEEFAAADKFILGTIGADSPLPVMSRPWRVERDGEGRLVAKASSGLSIVIR